MSGPVVHMYIYQPRLGWDFKGIMLPLDMPHAVLISQFLAFYLSFNLPSFPDL